MTNFDIFTTDPQFAPFADTAVAAERILQIDPAACVLNCRRAMESAVKWMYSVDAELTTPPYRDVKLVQLMSTEDFRKIIGDDLYRRMDLIRRYGNNAAHTGKTITRNQAALCLENLFIFLDFVAYCYGDTYEERQFDYALLVPNQDAERPAPVPPESPDLQALLEENAALREQLTARREEQQPTYVPKPLDLTEYQPR